MILAVADDISGAAEVAAVGRTFGLAAQIQMKAVKSVSSDLVVIDTDTRYRAGEPAHDIEQALANFDRTAVQWYYKKVDSVLRGNVAAELSAMMKALQKSRTILAPANPTRARVISNGEYFINDQPLHETEFANDPEYPATSSSIADLLNVPRGCPLHLRTCENYTGFEHGIIVAEAQSMRDLVRWAEYVDERTLAAGGSDFFRAVLEKRLVSNGAPSETEVAAVPGKRLFVCGSTSEVSRRAVARARDLGVPVCPMPDDLFKATAADDALITQWADSVLKVLSASDRVVIAIIQPVVRDPKLARNLRIEIAAVVKKIVSSAKIHELLIDGGATAEAVLRGLQCKALDVLGQYAPGVVQMRVAGQSERYFTIKPGSYLWPDGIWI